jgi:hypothetical protein
MTELDLLHTEEWGAPVTFTPQRAKLRDAQADAVIALARRVKDWPLLEKAVDQKIQDQAALVRWWQDNVRSANRPKTVADLRQLSVAEAEQLSGVTKQLVHRWASRLKDPDAYRAYLFGAAWRAAMGQMVTGSQLVLQSLSNEYYTPRQYVEAARTVLGSIDLDPATSETANRTVRARRFFTAQQDGLTKEWRGRVFLNPPYGGQAGAFVSKLCREYAAGHVTAAILVLSSRATETSWFAPMWDGTLCFTDHRIEFYGKSKFSPTTGSIFVYLGNHPARFAECFKQFGAVVRRFE